MSHKWTYKAISEIAENQMKALRKSIHEEKFRFIGLHDNVDLPLQIHREQRLENMKEFPGGGQLVQLSK